MEYISWFSNRIRAERKRLGLTAREAAKLCGVTAVKWSRFEKGEEAPGLRHYFYLHNWGLI